MRCRGTPGTFRRQRNVPRCLGPQELVPLVRVPKPPTIHYQPATKKLFDSPACYHGSKISGSQQSFLTETAIYLVQRCMGYRFVPERSHAQESHTGQFFRLTLTLPTIFVGLRFVEI